MAAASPTCSTAGSPAPPEQGWRRPHRSGYSSAGLREEGARWSGRVTANDPGVTAGVLTPDVHPARRRWHEDLVTLGAQCLLMQAVTGFADARPAVLGLIGAVVVGGRA